MIVTSFLNGFVYLAGMVMYDIFWVYGSNVMISVAQGIQLPIKLTFPVDPWSSTTKLYAFGIGDIIMPGIFISLMFRFDFLNQAT